MKISTKGRYGLRVMIHLARNYSESYISIKKIATEQEISSKYLEQIIHLLNKAGLVESTRGSHGGYRLIRDPSKIYLGEILRALEGELDIVGCLKKEVCEKQASCVSQKLWKRIETSILDIVDKETLYDLINDSEF